MSILRSLLSGSAPLRAPDDPAGASGTTPPAAVAEPAPAVAAEAAPAAGPDTPGKEAAPAAAPGDAKPADKPADKPANEFAPSLLDQAAKAKEDPAAKPGADAAAKDGKAPDAKAADAKPTDAPGETPSAPVKYEFTYPEGVKPEEVNAERMSAYTGILGEAKVAPEVGQKLLDLHLSEVKHVADAMAQRQWDTFNELQKQWRDTVMADPELGGARHATAIQTVMSLVEQYGGNADERKGLLDAFRVTGAANNPHILRLLHRAGEALAREAKPHPAPPPRSAALSGRDRGLARYSGNGARAAT